jgi:hypothetical protein
LNHEEIRNVGLACRTLPFGVTIPPRDRRYWYVITVKIGTDEIHLVYPLGGRTLLEKARCAPAVEDAAFYVYKDKAYFSNAPLSRALLNSIKNACPVGTSVLIDWPNNRKPRETPQKNCASNSPKHAAGGNKP